MKHDGTTASDHALASGAKRGSAATALKFCTSASMFSAMACADADIARVSTVGLATTECLQTRIGDEVARRVRDGNLVPDVGGP